MVFNIRRFENTELRHIGMDELKAMTDEALRCLFIGASWHALDKETRLNALQLVENRSAVRDGRQPYRILEGDDEDFRDNPGLMGYCNAYQHVLVLNYRFLIGSSAYHSGLEALDTVLHEGRHATQNHLMDHRPDLLSAQVLREWLSSRAVYFNPANADPQFAQKIRALYMLQPVEMDARRFARRSIMKLAESRVRSGGGAKDVLDHLQKTYDQEYKMIQLVRSHLTMEEIDSVEKLVIDAMRRRFPNLDLDGFRLFDNARLILTEKLESSLDYLRLVQKLDEQADEHMDRALDREDELRCLRRRNLELGIRAAKLA